MADEVGSPQARRKKAFALADELALTRQDRIDLAEAILWRDVESWKHLNDEQISRLLDAMEGYEKISHLLETSAMRAHPSMRASTASAQSAPAG